MVRSRSPVQFRPTALIWKLRPVWTEFSYQKLDDGIEPEEKAKKQTVHMANVLDIFNHLFGIMLQQRSKLKEPIFKIFNHEQYLLLVVISGYRCEGIVAFCQSFALVIQPGFAISWAFGYNPFHGKSKASRHVDHDALHDLQAQEQLYPQKQEAGGA